MQLLSSLLPLTLVLLLLAACSDGPPRAENTSTGATDPSQDSAVATVGKDPFLSEQDTLQEPDAGEEQDTAWTRLSRSESDADQDTSGSAEQWTDIAPDRLNNQPMRLPLDSTAGPSVLRVQVLLDRTSFSPGILDGRWGKNTEKAIRWMQEREGLSADGQVDSTTFDHLLALAGRPQQIVIQHDLTEDEVSGPFVDIPDDIQEKAELDCLCYESLAEKLGELFHVTPDLLTQLNPDMELNALQAGNTIWVPNLSSPDTSAAPPIAEIIISDSGHYLHAMDDQGRIAYHFPSTLGSSYEPSPQGRYEVDAIQEDPWWHYQPELLADVPDTLESVRVPPGPNNAVGRVWIDLSKPHYGIHGTSNPASIGYTTSAGCVRLTNWDALFLARRIERGTPVRFVDSR